MNSIKEPINPKKTVEELNSLVFQDKIGELKYFFSRAMGLAGNGYGLKMRVSQQVLAQIF